MLLCVIGSQWRPGKGVDRKWGGKSRGEKEKEKPWKYQI